MVRNSSMFVDHTADRAELITRKEIRISYQIGTTPRLHVKITSQSDDQSDDDRKRYQHDTTYLANFSDTQLENTINSDQMYQFLSQRTDNY